MYLLSVDLDSFDSFPDCFCAINGVVTNEEFVFGFDSKNRRCLKLVAPGISRIIHWFQIPAAIFNHLPSTIGLMPSRGLSAQSLSVALRINSMQIYLTQPLYALLR
jgi:hypothetical protein